MDNNIKPLEGDELIKYLHKRLDAKHRLWLRAHHNEVMFKDKLKRISNIIDNNLNFYPCLNCDKPCDKCDIKKVIEILRET